ADVRSAVSDAHRESTAEPRAPFRRIIVSKMFREAGGYLRWNMALAGVNRAYHPQHLILRRALEEICRSPGPHRSLDFAIGIGSGQDNNASLREFPSNGDQRVDSVSSRETQIHKSHVRATTAKFRHGLHRIR